MGGGGDGWGSGLTICVFVILSNHPTPYSTNGPLIN